MSAVVRPIIFRTRGGPTHGWGNVFRLAEFAAYCRERLGSTPHFVVEGPAEIETFLEWRGFTVTTLPEGVSITQESEFFASKSMAQHIVMEMLDVTYERQKMLKNYTDDLVVFDDLMDHQYCADKVFCTQLLPDYGNRDISDTKTQFFIGLDYFILNSSFSTYIDKKRDHKLDLERILITLGGGRYDAAYLKCAKTLANFPHIDTTFVLGPAEKERLESAIGEYLPDASIIGASDDIATLMWEHDAAIVSAGYTKIEAAATGTPAAMISTQWHQIPLGQMFHNFTGMPDLGYMGFLTISQLSAAISELTSQDFRRIKSNQAKKVVDGNGAKRVFDTIFLNRQDTELQYTQQG